MKKKPIYSFFKRAFDIVFSLLSILLLSLPLLVVALAVKLDSRGPVFFSQERIGKNKKRFRILKFRSMFTDTDPNAPTHTLDDPEAHITKVGRFIRKTSIDELPQLFNILAGQMSFVGPRPALWNQDDLVAERDKYGANDIRPGLTGWAQINGRDELEIPIKAKFDGEYVQKLSFAFDCRCFFGTIGKVLRGDDVAVGAQEKTEEKEASSV